MAYIKKQKDDKEAEAEKELAKEKAKQGIEHIEIFEQADWEVTKLEHEKGHMVNLNQLNELKSTIQSMADS